MLEELRLITPIIWRAWFVFISQSYSSFDSKQTGNLHLNNNNSCSSFHLLRLR